MAADESSQQSEMGAEIVRAATRLFAAQGYEGTSLQEIADAVGVKRQSLLYHYRSKEHIHQAVLETLLAHWNETLPRVLMAATAGERQFDAVVSEIVSFFADDTDRARLLIREALDRPKEMRGRLRKHVRPVVAHVAELVRKGQARGEIREDVDPESYLFQVILLLVCGGAFLSSFSPLMPAESPHGPPLARLQSELSRMAKASLFVQASQPASSSQRQKAPARRRAP